MKVLLVFLLIFCYSCQKTDMREELAIPDEVFGIYGNHLVDLSIDSTSLLRNPCMGWVMYDDAWLEVENAEDYWKLQDEAARKYASIFYIRWRWSDMEPEEGKYAWIYNENFKKLVKGALDRGLKLAFRIYYNSRDNLYPATPEFVREAGAKIYWVNGLYQEFWTPYPDDPVFQEKLSNFVKAFAKEFDNPDIVDYVDGFNLGFWGEGNNIILQDPTKMSEVSEQIFKIYSDSFKNVILLTNYNSDVGYECEKAIAVEKYGYGLRRDGLGSFWFRDIDKLVALEEFPRTLLIGEGAYWKGNTDDYRPWDKDPIFPSDGSTTWRDFYMMSCKHALHYHFNTLDLREVVETQGWTTRALDQVELFVKKGGYRLCPYSISVPVKIVNGSEFVIGHSWRNLATGIFPNSNKRWNNKYKIAFALLDNNYNVVKIMLDNQSDLSRFIYGYDFINYFKYTVNNIPKGSYILSLAIVDTSKANEPAIKIALKTDHLLHGWFPLSSVEVL